MDLVWDAEGLPQFHEYPEGSKKEGQLLVAPGPQLRGYVCGTERVYFRIGADLRPACVLLSQRPGRLHARHIDSLGREITPICKLKPTE